jgi:hypothetical protein
MKSDTSTALLVLVIDFVDSSDHISRQLEGVVDCKVRQIPAVVSSNHPRWRCSQSRSAIGAGAGGCLLAHLDALTYLAAESPESGRDPVGLVLESDAELTSYGRRNLPRVLAYMDTVKLNFLQLGSNRTSFTNTAVPGRHRALDRMETGVLNHVPPLFTQALTSVAHAYAIRASFAQYILELDIGFQLPIDNWFRALALDPNHAMGRVRQDLFVTSGRPSQINVHGR